MRFRLFIVFILSNLIYSGCVFHSSASLLKKMECSQVQKTGLIYVVKYKSKPLNLPSRIENNIHTSPFYRLNFTSEESVEFEKDYCEIIKNLKNCHLRNRKSSLFKQKEKILSKDSIYIHFLSILFSRKEKEDELAITPKDGGFVFLFEGESYRGLSNHSDKMWEYASEKYFNNVEVQEKLIQLANKMIKYRNEKVKNEISLSDSLRRAYPLISY
jgi:hypothetical protein